MGAIMSFLPSNYEVPTESNYMKLEKGKNKFRILGSAVVGNEYWKTVDGSRRPIRKRLGESIPASDIEINPRSGELEKVKHFWAFPVWNYQANKVQILELTQKTVMKAVTGLVENEDWGDPKDYDLTVSRDGDGLDTEYTVAPSPHKQVAVEVTESLKQATINLDALFEGEDPFQATERQMEEALA
jgi:hypothetical protein